MPSIIHTIGHSTRALDELVAMLAAHGVVTLADVRRYPASRRHPHFNADVLAENLPAAGIRYVPFRTLGGRRTALPLRESSNTGWRVEGFRGYADYMQTRDFACALDELMSLAAAEPTAIMCAEALHWRCHRSLIADALLARGWNVLHITGPDPTTAARHALRDFAKVDGETITYPPPESEADGQALLAFD